MNYQCPKCGDSEFERTFPSVDADLQCAKCLNDSIIQCETAQYNCPKPECNSKRRIGKQINAKSLSGDDLGIIPVIICQDCNYAWYLPEVRTVSYQNFHGNRVDQH